MMSTDVVTPMVHDVGPEHYRALSNAAVASVVLGCLSVLMLPAATSGVQACVMMAPIPLVGIFCGLRALSAIRRMPAELAGSRLAVLGLCLSAAFLVLGGSTATYIYATEVPDGHTRISYSMLRPDGRELARGRAVPDDIQALDGKAVFIKGYMRPSSQAYGLDEFLLVRDNNECCFGAIDKVKYFDRVQVQLTDGMRADYRRGVVRVAGVLRVVASHARRGPGYAVFSIEANYVR